MSKPFQVGRQKWQAETCDLAETLTKFLLNFLTTNDEGNHPGAAICSAIDFRGIPPTFSPSS